MPFFLRKIRYTRWYISEGVSWLGENDVPADPLGDLATTRNELSVWHIEDNLSNLSQVIAALATNVENISNLDYALFDQSLLGRINMRVKPSNGGTPDEKVNECHRDIIELSGLRLVSLAVSLLSSSERKRVEKNEVMNLIAEGIKAGRINRKKVRLKPDEMAKIDKLINTSEQLN